MTGHMLMLIRILLEKLITKPEMKKKVIKMCPREVDKESARSRKRGASFTK